MHDTRRAALSDIAFGTIALLGVGALLVDAADLGARARMFPVAVLWCLILAALATVGEGIVRFRRADAKGGDHTSGGLVQFALPSLLMIAGGVLLLGFGFYITAPILILAMHMLHTRLSTGVAPTARSLATGATLAGIATGAMYLIFAVLIGLPAPSGSFL